MAKLLLTETCVQSCPYCFAKQYMTEADVQGSLSRDNCYCGKNHFLLVVTDFYSFFVEKHMEKIDLYYFMKLLKHLTKASYTYET